VLTVTSLYPNAAQPQRGVFVRERLRRLEAQHDVATTVIAPVPWFPLRSARFGAYAVYARVPSEESTVDGVVFHPRFFHLPKVSELFSPFAFAASVMRTVRRARLEVDVVDGQFLFPDGVAAVMVARALRRPVVLTARGSDVNLIAHEAVAGRWIRWAVRRADALVAVSRELADELETIAHRDVTLIGNGVDRTRFAPAQDRGRLRAELGLTGFTVVSVGNLVPLKGHDLVIDAVASLDDVSLVIVGDGPSRADLVQKVASSGLGERVRFLSSLPQERLADYYRAADVLVLASSHEGLPNVVLESLACGTPVVATATGGAREILCGTRAGILCERNAPSIARAIESLRTAMPERALVASAVERFDWNVCADRLHGLLAGVAAARAAA